MDTTEQYIKMCDCPEIQDFIEGNRLLGAPWLPRLDQLIEMLPKRRSFLDIQEGMVWPYVWRNSRGLKSPESFVGKTPEQALIQGVMHELHGKKWDGEKWG